MIHEPQAREAVEVELNADELLLISMVAGIRQSRNLEKGRKQRWNTTGEGYTRHLQGAIGEFIVCRYFNTNWSGMFTLGACDVGDWEVRTCQAEGRLIIHKGSDDPAARYILVRETAKWYQFTIEGWIRGEDAMKEEFIDDPVGRNPKRDTFWVPADKLTQIPRGFEA